MTPDPDPRPTALQQSILRILWDRGRATVTEVRDALAGERDLAPTTVATILKRLEQRGLVGHERDGRQFLWFAVKDESEVGRDLVGGLARHLYGGRAADLFAHLLDTGSVSADDLKRIKRMIRDAER